MPARADLAQSLRTKVPNYLRQSHKTLSVNDLSHSRAIAGVGFDNGGI